MGLFEKIELEPIEVEEERGLPQSSRQWKGETFTVTYNPVMKVIIILVALFMSPVFRGFVEDGLFLFEVMAAAAAVIGVWYLGDCLLTRDFTFTPGSIVKRGYFGQTSLPTDAVVMNADNQKIRLFHGSEKNIRESVTIRMFLITAGEGADIRKYAEDVYRAKAGAGKKIDSPEGKHHSSKLALIGFNSSISTYRTMGVLFVVFSLIALFTVGCSDNFYGFAPSLPEFTLRLACIGLAVAGYFLLRRIAAVSMSGRSDQPVNVRMKRADNSNAMIALTACGVSLLGLVLLLLFGNMLDFYLFLLVGILFFRDFYPRLSDWEKMVQGTRAQQSDKTVPAILPRRSLQVSLVLMGSLAAMSYGETRHYLYNNRQDCLKDWGDDGNCREAPGNGYYGTHYYYGPRYGGGGVRPGRSVGLATVSRGGFGSLGSLHASFGG